MPPPSRKPCAVIGVYPSPAFSLVALLTGRVCTFLRTLHRVESQAAASSSEGAPHTLCAFVRQFRSRRWGRRISSTTARLDERLPAREPGLVFSARPPQATSQAFPVHDWRVCV